MVKFEPDSGLSPPQRLAIAYAPGEIRDAFRWLLMFDARLRDVLERAREPMIAQLRFAWWRDALQKPLQERPKGEPLLGQLGALGADLPTLAADMVDAYEALIDAPGESSLRPLFTAYHGLLTGTDEELTAVEMLADGWQLTKARRLRPLSILALATQLEQRGGRANGLRLSWHALTGR